MDPETTTALPCAECAAHAERLAALERAVMLLCAGFIVLSAAIYLTDKGKI